MAWTEGKISISELYYRVINSLLIIVTNHALMHFLKYDYRRDYYYLVSVILLYVISIPIISAVVVYVIDNEFVNLIVNLL